MSRLIIPMSQRLGWGSEDAFCLTPTQLAWWLEGLNAATVAANKRAEEVAAQRMPR